MQTKLLIVGPANSQYSVTDGCVNIKNHTSLRLRRRCRKHRHKYFQFKSAMFETGRQKPIRTLLTLRNPILTNIHISDTNTNVWKLLPVCGHKLVKWLLSTNLTSSRPKQPDSIEKSRRRHQKRCRRLESAILKMAVNNRLVLYDPSTGRNRQENQQREANTRQCGWLYIKQRLQQNLLNQHSAAVQ